MANNYRQLTGQIVKNVNSHISETEKIIANALKLKAGRKGIAMMYCYDE
jgi:chemotaxis regulatin CheY-phosphate phosphatase CheZ